MSLRVFIAVAQVEMDGKMESVMLSHFWPVRYGRPAAEKLPGKIPMSAPPLPCAEVVAAAWTMVPLQKRNRPLAFARSTGWWSSLAL